MDRKPSAVSGDIKFSYPSFSRAHSKEVIGSRENVINPRLSLYTPDATILDSDDRLGRKGEPKSAGATFGAMPPSPPLTAQDPDLRRSKSGHSMRTTPSSAKTESRNRPNSLDGSILPRLDIRGATTKSSSKPRNSNESNADTIESNKHRTKQPTNVSDVEYEIVSDLPSDGHYSGRQSTVTADSEATPQPYGAKSHPPIPTNARSSPQTVSDPSPKTPTSVHTFPNLQEHGKDATNAEPVGHFPEESLSPQTPGLSNAVPPPPPLPPPPPPAPGQFEAPRVDYLLQNGGLPSVAPRNFFFSNITMSPIAQTSPLNPPSTPFFRSRQTEASKIFAPFNKVLEDYLQVISKNGSIAVATGYRSVARRLLDRLETVFNRNISSETCDCIMCSGKPLSPTISESEETGLSWGEILEYVSGRRDLPSWPPFTISADAQNPDLATVAQAPMQKLDVDVPEEYREHYVRQSKKTKQVVQAWLHSQPQIPTSPPQEVDDETLLFAMFTHLEPEKRKLFTALLRGLPKVQTSRAPTPLDKARPELMVRTSLALQRLYRLQATPRDSECALYLLKNSALHGVLATLAAISSHEWDILVSGRFDGFLWSGAESAPATTPTSHPPSRNTTPFSGVSATTSNATASTRNGGSGARAPVQLDEDTEIAVLAEVEREIYAGMDALEDAFEALHAKAETVRAALRARAGGLSMSASHRRGSVDIRPEVRGWTDTPGSGSTQHPSAPWIASSAGLWDGVMDDGVDLRSELAPDDSASNISSRRRRKRVDRKDVRTPLTVAEEEDDD
jgi:hypothetical protein